jgi:hypothetical protein
MTHRAFRSPNAVVTADLSKFWEVGNRTCETAALRRRSHYDKAVPSIGGPSTMVAETFEGLDGARFVIPIRFKQAIAFVDGKTHAAHGFEVASA